MNNYSTPKSDERGSITILASIAVCATLVVASAASCALTGSGAESESQPAATVPAQDFNLKDLSGKSVKLSDYRGKVVVVNFWATWCGPCRAEIPDFVKLREQFHSRGLEIIGISLDRGGPDGVAKFVQRLKVNYPIVMGTQETVDSYGPITGIPATFVIDRKGRIHSRHLGLMSFSKIESAIKPLL